LNVHGGANIETFLQAFANEEVDLTKIADEANGNDGWGGEGEGAAPQEQDNPDAGDAW
jgi:hypothetical protein